VPYYPFAKNVECFCTVNPGSSHAPPTSGGGRAGARGAIVPHDTDICSQHKFLVAIVSAIEKGSSGLFQKGVIPVTAGFCDRIAERRENSDILNLNRTSLESMDEEKSLIEGRWHAISPGGLRGPFPFVYLPGKRGIPFSKPVKKSAGSYEHEIFIKKYLTPSLLSSARCP
jgi:hypothetical protein